MKLRVIIPICIFLVHCTNKEQDNSKRTHASLDIQLVQKIQDYYIEGEGNGLHYEINEHDSLNELFFWENEGFTLMRILVPKVSSEETPEVLSHDLNQDGLNDKIIKIYREGGWAGGNTHDTEILIFENQGNEFIFKSANNSKNLTDCINGQFYLEGLEDGKLIGTSNCYAPEDAHCCPSLEFKTTLLEKDWELEHLTSEKK